MPAESCNRSGVHLGSEGANSTRLHAKESRHRLGCDVHREVGHRGMHCLQDSLAMQGALHW
jgi:hypothetical protein